MRRQRGLGFAGVLTLMVAIVFLAVIGMKLVPAYLEFFTIKKAVTGMVQSGELRGTSSVGDVRKAFERRQAVDDFSAIGPNDLEVTKEGNEIVISFAYEKRIPLFYNISVLIDFAGSSKPGNTKSPD
jgi:hypothetical protein